MARTSRLVLCYVVIGAYWLQHHYSGRSYRKSDHWFDALNLVFLLAIIVIPYPIRSWCFHLGTLFEATEAVTLVAVLALTACTWMGKWFYGTSGGRRADGRTPRTRFPPADYPSLRNRNASRSPQFP
jgi:uncharacterized membrane protein